MASYDTTAGLARDASDTELRTSLLRATLEHAWLTSPFYRTLWGRQPVDVHTPADLPALPFVTKQQIDSNLDDVVTTKGMPDLIQFTGGTMGVASLRYRTEAESRWLGERNRILEKMSGGPRKLCLHVLVPFNGPEIFVAEWPSINVPLVLEKHFRQVDGLLRREYAFDGWERRVSTIISGLDRLKMLTTYLLERGTDFSAYGVRTIVTSASFLSRHWRRILEESWNARVIDVFGLSEVSDGVAVECDRCTGHHMAPIAIAEVVSLKDRTPIDAGTGILVMTGLYPFVQTQPFIRYWTDDLVEIAPPCPATREPGLRFRGRRSQSVVVDIDGEPSPVLFPTDIVDVLDDLPEVAIEPEVIVQGLRSRDIGYHKWRVETRQTGQMPDVLVHVELKFSPCLYRDRTRTLREQIRTDLLSRNRCCARLIEAGRLSLDVVPHEPGTIDKVIV